MIVFKGGVVKEGKRKEYNFILVKKYFLMYEKYKIRKKKVDFKFLSIINI